MHPDDERELVKFVTTAAETIKEQGELIAELTKQLDRVADILASLDGRVSDLERS